ncbi:MAG TPA: sulfurtransferase TusA family protein [Rhodospirillales bacterium]|nr:sulfurtransferase TusA family protein [Rhodospirillales bacterium]
MTEKTILDVKGLGCPVPILRANRAIKELICGDTLEVLATDCGAPQDFEIFCQTTGHKLLENISQDGVFFIRIEVTS